MVHYFGAKPIYSKRTWGAIDAFHSLLAFFLAFFAAFFSFGDIAGVFLLSLVPFFSLLMLILNIVDMELNLKIG